MVRCDRPGCRWQAIAATQEGAAEQYARHLVEQHTTECEGEVPDGMVQVRFDDAEEWQTVTPEEAKRIHALRHGRDRGGD